MSYSDKVAALTKFPISRYKIRRMDEAELQQNIEKYAKRLNQRIADIRRYAGQIGAPISDLQFEVARTLGSYTASRAKVRDADEGRARLLAIKKAYEKFPKLTRTGLNAFYDSKIDYFSRLMFGADKSGKPRGTLTRQQVIRLMSAATDEQGIFNDSDIYELFHVEPITDKFDNVDEFITWLENNVNSTTDMFKKYQDYKSEKGDSE